MRSRTRPSHPAAQPTHPAAQSADPAVPPAPRAAPRAPRAALRVGRTLRAVIDWLRAGYPDEAPIHGHSPLMALNGPIALSPNQTDQIVNELGGRPADPLAIDVAITKATDRLPTPRQVSKIVRALDGEPQ